jgi:hypothetical protein
MFFEPMNFLLPLIRIVLKIDIQFCCLPHRGQLCSVQCMPERCPAAWRLPQTVAQASAPPAAGCSGPAPYNAGTGLGPRVAICPALEVFKNK